MLWTNPGFQRGHGRRKSRWIDGADARKLGRRNLRANAQDRGRWRRLLEEAKAHPGLYSRWRWWIICAEMKSCAMQTRYRTHTQRTPHKTTVTPIKWSFITKQDLLRGFIRTAWLGVISSCCKYQRYPKQCPQKFLFNRTYKQIKFSKISNIQVFRQRILLLNLHVSSNIKRTA